MMRRLVPDSRPFSFVPSQKYRTWHITVDIYSYIFSEIQYQTKSIQHISNGTLYR